MSNLSSSSALSLSLRAFGDDYIPGGPLKMKDVIFSPRERLLCSTLEIGESLGDEWEGGVLA